MPQPAAAAATAGTPIPFAQTAEGQAGSPWALGVTVMLLVAACVALWVIRQRGYLQRWVGAAGVGSPKGLRVVQRLRLGMHSQAYVLEDGEDRWMVVEGRQGMQTIALARRMDKDAS